MVRTQSSDVSLNMAKLTALFSSLAAALYAATKAEPSPIVGLFLSGGPLIAVILWLQKDAGRTGVGTVQDWGYFLLLAWPIVIPWYAFKTRGRGGWALLLGLFGLILSASMTGLAVSWLVYIAKYTVWYFQAGA
jgi:hypothetical protein